MRLPRPPRTARAPRFAAPPRAPAAPDARSAPASTAADPSAAPPAGWTDSLAAWTAYRWMLARGVPFRYAPPSGPASGGASTGPTFLVADRSPGLVLDVTGTATSASAQAGLVRGAQATAAGYGYASVSAADLLLDADRAMTTALGGQ